MSITKYAFYWQRLLGWLIDIVLLYPISWVIQEQTINLGIIPSNIIFFISLGFYYVIFWVRWGATPGMLLMKIKIVPINGVMTVGRGISRYIGGIISSLCFTLGHLWMLWDKKSQTWQDKMAKTIVIRVEPEEKEKTDV
ncbi:MAG TPA: RDD family protein [Nitrospirae bacterium]|nr:RDD family protein [Nitrospirota bacterium]